MSDKYKTATVFLAGAICGLSLAAMFLAYRTWPRHGMIRFRLGGLIERPGSGAPPPAPFDSSAATAALQAQFQSYSDRADDLQKLISVLVGLASLYAIVLGLSSYVTSQSTQKELLAIESGAKESLERLRGIESEWAEVKKEIKKGDTYGLRLAIGDSALALAMQNKYPDYVRGAINSLKALRPDHPADQLLNLSIGSLHKALKEFAFAEGAMTFYLREREIARKSDDSGAFNAHYNRACYRSLQWPGAKDAHEQEQIRLGVESDLQESLRLSQELGLLTADAFLQQIKNEDDFTPVRNLDWFKPWNKP
jgi:hypothetical protein